jgi:pyruvate dehydrogenase E2 component (dihydrolipoamide acetyltransferase)
MVSEGTLVGYGPVAMPTQRRARRPKTRGSGPQRPGFGVPKPEGRREEGRTTREPVKGVRKAMAETMTESARTIPQVTIWKSVDLTGLAGGPLVAVARASMEALRLHPLLNSRWADEEIVRRHFVHLGIAVATERGLIVPVIRDADVLSEDGLREAIKEASATARAGRTAPADQVGGTFTITNVGPLGMEGGTPLLTPDQSAILCLGAVERRPWVVTSAGEERLAIRSVATLALTFDHRHIDGAAAAAFLAEIADRLTSSFESGGVGSAS